MPADSTVTEHRQSRCASWRRRNPRGGRHRLPDMGTPVDYEVTIDLCHSGDPAGTTGFFLPLGGPCLVTQAADGGIDTNPSNDEEISRPVNDTNR